MVRACGVRVICGAHHNSQVKKVAQVAGEEWDRPYTRADAAFPLEGKSIGRKVQGDL